MAVTALMMPILIGSAGLASDTIQWTLVKRMMQRQADSGALAGAYALSQASGTQAQITAAVNAAVNSDIGRNGGYKMTVTPVIATPATAGFYKDAASAVRVQLATDMRLPFTGMFSGQVTRISAAAVGEIVGNGNYCVLALETTNTTGIPIGGNATVDLGCGMMSNSPALNSAEAGGSSSVKASPVAAVGGVPNGNWATGTVRIPYSVPLRDPFRAVPDPNVFTNGSALNVGSNRSSTLNPGTYSNVSIQGTALMAPGEYIVTGSLDIGSQARVTGAGVVFVLTANNAASNTGSIATVRINGGAQINLTAPATGTYAGILMYQDRRATNAATNIINGNSASRFQGAFYFPRQQLQFNGTSGANTACLQLVARTIDIRGNASITNVCPANSGAKSFDGTQIKVVS